MQISKCMQDLRELWWAKYMKKEGKKAKKKTIKMLAYCALGKTKCLKIPIDFMLAKNSKCVNMQAILTNTCEKSLKV